MLKFILFDVNETLLDIHAIELELQGLFGKDVSVREWFFEVLQHTLVLNEVKEYYPFSEVAEAVLRMRAVSQGRQIRPDELEAVRKKLSTLPPYADVKVALQRLKGSGLRLATLTNSSERSQEQQMTNAGLTEYFEKMLSVDMVRRFKPAWETYRAAINALGVRPQETMMVAAHGWDLLGAMKAGCRAALLARPGKAAFPFGPQPELIAENLIELAEKITSAHHQGEA